MLTKKTESDPKWYPIPIHKLDSLLIKVISSGQGYRHTYELRRNIAYNLQYLEYLDRTINDLKLSSVLIKQTRKSFIITGCGIIESLLHYRLITRDLHNKTEWEKITVMPGNPKKCDDEYRKVDAHIYKKRNTPRIDHMTFDSMLKKAESKHILGNKHGIYPMLKSLRQLRNKIHLQEIGNDNDTDWNAFKYSEMCLMAQVVQRVFTSTIFNPSAEEKKYFEYLSNYVDN